MAAKEYAVPLVRQTGEISQGVFLFDLSAAQCRLTLRYSAGEITSEASDWFDALCRIREELEVRGWRPVCFGSNQNVYASGMCRSMARGAKAYRTELGRRAMRTDLVNIFDTAPNLQAATVEEQQRFHEQWLQSLGFKLKR